MAQWEQPPHLARVPCGRGFDVLRLPQVLGLTLLWELDQDDQDHEVPVLEQHNRPKPWIYILAQPGTARAWTNRRLPPRVSLLTAGDTLLVPSPLADAITGVQQHHQLWRTPPTGDGHLAHADQLAEALDRALDPHWQAARIRNARAAFYKGRHRST